MPLPSTASAAVTRLRRIVASLGLVAGIGACHTFPDDPNATRWPSEPSAPPLTFVSGRVFVQGSLTPLQGVVVSSANFSTVTNADGFYALDGQRSIQTLVVAAKDGFDTTKVGLQLPGGNMTFNLQMRAQQP